MQIRRANKRGHANHGWLDTYHTFSFADYHDPAWMGFRSLRVLNDDLVLPGMGFARHPHRDMEILTYVLSGRLSHEDSLGNKRVIQPGEVQYMAAGSGVRHSEFNPSREEAVHFLQIWLLPDAQGVDPRYEERAVPRETGASLIASKQGREKSIAINQDADLWLAQLDPDDSIEHTLADNRHAWIQLADGEIALGETTLKPGDGASISEGGTLKFTAIKPSRFLIFDLN